MHIHFVTSRRLVRGGAELNGCLAAIKWRARGTPGRDTTKWTFRARARRPRAIPPPRARAIPRPARARPSRRPRRPRRTPDPDPRPPARYSARYSAAPMTTPTFDLKHRSRALTDGPERAAARAYLKGIGYDDDALARPLVAVANTWIETMPCNFHLRALAAKVKEGIRAAGGTPMELNTIAISDGITMGTAGMRASLVSREVIADSIELVADAHMFDAVVAISGCDKTIPGTVMALCRLNVPSVMLYGGSIMPGQLPRRAGHDPGGVRGRRRARRRSRSPTTELTELEDVASPGAGACGGQFTANTMAMAFEVLGISPAGFVDGPGDRSAQGRGRARGRRAGDRRARAAACAPATSSPRDSARERDRRDRLQRRLHQRRPAPAGDRQGDRASSSRSTTSTGSASAHRCCATSSRAAATSPSDLYEAGGVPLVMKRLKDAGLLHEQAIDRHRRDGRRASPRRRSETDGQQVVRPLDDPIKPTGGLAILRGNVAPEGCVVKLAGHERRLHTGPARVFESEEDAMRAVTDEPDQGRRRGRDPQRGPGRRPRHARDARGHRGARGRGARRGGRAASPTAASPAPRTA